MEKFIFAAICFAVFLNFGLSVFNVFVSHDDHHKFGYSLLKVGNIFSWVATFYLIFSYEAFSPNLLIIGSLIQLLCLCFFLYLKSLTKKKLTIAFSHDQPQMLFREGPYRYVRHPYYLCYLISYSTVAIIYPHPISAFFFVGMLAVYIWAALLEEKKFQKSPLSGEYQKYKSEAGMFWPVIRKK
jgi:protein-S-isoprenylcysteine O-methyltransferase Ste14